MLGEKDEEEKTDLEAKDQSPDDIGASDVVEAIPEDTSHKLLCGQQESVQRRVHSMRVSVPRHAPAGATPDSPRLSRRSTARPLRRCCCKEELEPVQVCKSLLLLVRERPRERCCRHAGINGGGAGIRLVGVGGCGGGETVEEETVLMGISWTSRLFVGIELRGRGGGGHGKGDRVRRKGRPGDGPGKRTGNGIGEGVVRRGSRVSHGTD